MDLMPEASSAPPQARRRYIWRSIVLGLSFLPLYLGSQFAEDAGASRPVVLIMGYAGLLALLGILYEFLTIIRQLDELQQRIHVTSMALAFGLVGSLFTVIGMNLELLNVRELPAEFTATFATMTMPLSIVVYYIVLHVFRRRYE